MKTRMTELFGIKHPIMLAGAAGLSTPELVAAVSNAGGLGLLASAASTGEQARADIRKTRTLTDKPFGMNFTLLNPGAGDLMKVAIEEKIPVVNYALGRVPEFIKAVHEYGGKIIATVAIVKHALRSEQDGADALSVTGYEAAAHGGDITSVVLIPTIASQVKIPVIGAGGFCDGRGLAAALALGAEGISMGTRFMMTKESRLHENFKQLVLKASVHDTLYSDRFDGLAARALKTKTTEAMMKRGAPIIETITSTLRVKRLLGVSWWELLRGALRTSKAEEISLAKLSRRTISLLQLEKAVVEGDEEKGFVYAGQNCGRIDDIPSCSEVIERIVAEAEEVLEEVRQKFQSNSNAKVRAPMKQK